MDQGRPLIVKSFNLNVDLRQFQFQLPSAHAYFLSVVAASGLAAVNPTVGDLVDRSVKGGKRGGARARDKKPNGSLGAGHDVVQIDDWASDQMNCGSNNLSARRLRDVEDGRLGAEKRSHETATPRPAECQARPKTV
jgi:hypothetical protein